MLGATYQVSLEQKDSGIDTSMSGEALAREMEALDRLAEDQGRPSLLEFFSVGEGDAGADLLRQSGVAFETEWFDPGEGLSTVRGLIDISEGEDSRFRDAKMLHKDLLALEKILTLAEAKGVRWRLAVSF